MQDSKACLFSYALDGGGAPVNLAALAPDDPRFVWIHLNGRHPDTKKILKDDIHLDPLIIKSMLAEETRPRFEQAPQGALLILRGINFNPGPTPEDLVSVRVWITSTRIITVCRRKSKAIADLNDRIAENRGPKTPGEFVTFLLTALNDGIEPVLAELEDLMDRLEETPLDGGDKDLRSDLADMRKQATQFRRHMTPQRDVINILRVSDLSWLTLADKWLLQDNLDRTTRLIEDLDTLRERSQILQDEFYNALSSRLNKNLAVLSVITVVFMPLTFITGLLGMNVAGIPGAHHDYAFGVVCVITIVLAAVQIYIFKKLKWF